MFTHSRKQNIVELCQELIREKSISGQEDKIVEKLKHVFTALGYDEMVIDEYGSIIGHIKGKRSGNKILLDAHIDVVPVPDATKWKHEPYGGDIENGRIYGRGTSDMKGALSAMICAASYFAEDLKRDFSGDIYVSGVVHEECFEGLAARKVSAAVNPDYVVIGEASGCNVVAGQKGRAEIVIETYGKPAHSATPQEGINAVYKAVGLIGKIRCIPSTHHDLLGDGLLELTDIKSSPYPGASVVPEYCKMTYDRRILVDETRETVLKPILAAIAEQEKEDRDFRARAFYACGEEKCYTGQTISGERFFPGWLINENDDYVRAVYDALQDAGLNPEIEYYKFCTNGSHYAGEAGIKTIGFGPSFANLAHTVDESIDIEQLLKGAEGYYAILQRLLN